MATKRPHAAMNAKVEEEEPVDPTDKLMFVALGGGNEVGRSCHIIQYKGKTVMLDAGIHPAYDGQGALPFYDDFDLSTVDILLISHFHMDHAASLPWVLAKSSFAGKVYMTHPTKAIYKWMMQDSVRVQNTHISSSSTSGTDGYISQLFNEQDVLSTLPMIQTISFHTTHTHNGIRFTPYPAGHVLGACMYLVEIAGLNILFTGDYSRENDRHLIPATVPKNVKVDCLISESTFGTLNHTPRIEREAALMKSITGILNRGGRALLPVSAIGRAQELLLILEDYWQRHDEYRRFPIYYASSLARKCMVVYQTYIDAMNDNIRAKFQAGQLGGGGGPWDFQFIRSLKSLERFDDVGGCVMLASPGFMQNGVSRSLLERWAPDAKNGVLITGYSVEGTMARQIMQEPESIPAIMNRQTQNAMMGKRPGMGIDGEKTMIPRRCTVQEISFAAHVDGRENREFIEEVNAPVVILVHGEKSNMNRMKSRLLGLMKFKVYSPANCEELFIPFRQDKVARVVGRLANEVQPPTLLPSPPVSEEDAGEEVENKRRREEGQLMSGVLVQNDFKISLMAPEDLKEYAGLTTTTIICRQKITLAAAGVELIRWALEGTFGSIATTTTSSADNSNEQAVNGNSGTIDINGKHDSEIQDEEEEHADEEIPRQNDTIFDIMGGAVRLTCASSGGQVELEWEGNATNDSIADAVMAVLLTIETSPAAVKQSSKLHDHDHGNGHESDELKADENSTAAAYDGFGDSPVDGKAPNGISGDLASMAAFGKGVNPLANLSSEEKLNRLFMFLEAQFGEDALTPIPEPQLDASMYNTGNDDDSKERDANGVDEIAYQKALADELARLHTLGIPVPGVQITVDDKKVRVWLETLEVECASKPLRERVRAVVERGLDTLAPLWV